MKSNPGRVEFDPMAKYKNVQYVWASYFSVNFELYVFGLRKTHMVGHVPEIIHLTSDVFPMLFK